MNRFMGRPFPGAMASSQAFLTLSDSCISCAFLARTASVFLVLAYPDLPACEIGANAGWSDDLNFTTGSLLASLVLVRSEYHEGKRESLLAIVLVSPGFLERERK